MVMVLVMVMVLSLCVYLRLKSIVLQRKYVATTRGYHNNNMYHLFNLCPFWKASKQIGDLETVEKEVVVGGRNSYVLRCQAHPLTMNLVLQHSVNCCI